MFGFLGNHNSNRNRKRVQNATDSQPFAGSIFKAYLVSSAKKWNRSVHVLLKIIQFRFHFLIGFFERLCLSQLVCDVRWITRVETREIKYCCISCCT